MNSANLRDSAASDEASPVRTSVLLRRILTDNPGVESFSVERILLSLGKERLEASLMVFALPAIVPVTSQRSDASLPIGAVAVQLITGQKPLQIPRFVLRRTISRKALAVAIHAVLPLLEASERVVRPRWKWVSHASTRRAVGLFVLLLALAIAWPLFGFNALHATSIFVMALGMAEKDGLAVLIGAVVGLLSLILFAVSGLSARAVRAKAAKWMRKVAVRLGLVSFARYLRARGYPRIARILVFQWSDILLLWDPEGKAARRTAARGAVPPRALTGPTPKVSVAAVSTAVFALRPNPTGGRA